MCVQLVIVTFVIVCGVIIALLWNNTMKYYNLKARVNERFEYALNKKAEKILRELISKFDDVIPEFETLDVRRKTMTVLRTVDGVAMESPALVGDLFDFCDVRVQNEHLSNMHLVREFVLKFCRLCRNYAIKINTMRWDEKLDIIFANDVDFELSFNRTLSMIDRLEKYLD